MDKYNILKENGTETIFLDMVMGESKDDALKRYFKKVKEEHNVFKVRNGSAGPINGNLIYAEEA